MYNVIDKVSKTPIKVSAIDVSKHLHISGIEFTPSMLEGLPATTTKKVAPIVEEVVEEIVEETIEEVVEETEEIEAPKKGRKANK